MAELIAAYSEPDLQRKIRTVYEAYLKLASLLLLSALVLTAPGLPLNMCFTSYRVMPSHVES